MKVFFPYSNSPLLPPAFSVHIMMINVGIGCVRPGYTLGNYLCTLSSGITNIGDMKNTFGECSLWDDWLLTSLPGSLNQLIGSADKEVLEKFLNWFNYSCQITKWRLSWTAILLDLRWTERLDWNSCWPVSEKCGLLCRTRRFMICFQSGWG